jgi:hypothetical protein
MRVKPSDAKGILDILLGRSGTQGDNPKKNKRSLDAFALLSLPEHLRKTAYAIHKTGRATAAMIAEVTGRDGIVETSNLNELVEMGYLERRESDKNVLYQIW